MANFPKEVTDYLDAFAQANPDSGLPTITKHTRGWWGIRSAGSSYVCPKRLREIVAMTDRLRARALSPTPAPKED